MDVSGYASIEGCVEGRQTHVSGCVGVGDRVSALTGCAYGRG